MAALTLILDGGKGTLAVLLAGVYGPDMAVLAGGGAFIGHHWNPTEDIILFELKVNLANKLRKVSPVMDVTLDTAQQIENVEGPNVRPTTSIKNIQNLSYS